MNPSDYREASIVRLVDRYDKQRCRFRCNAVEQKITGYTLGSNERLSSWQKGFRNSSSAGNDRQRSQGSIPKNRACHDRMSVSISARARRYPPGEMRSGNSLYISRIFFPLFSRVADKLDQEETVHSPRPRFAAHEIIGWRRDKNPHFIPSNILLRVWGDCITDMLWK